MGRVDRGAGLLAGDLLVHERERGIAARLDAEEDAKAAGGPQAGGELVVERVDAAQALPREAQAAARDLVAEGQHAGAPQREDVVGEGDAVVAQGQRLFDLVEHVARRTLAIRVAEDHVAAELTGKGTAAGAHHGRDGVAVRPPPEGDVGLVGQQVARRKGELVESAGEEPGRGVGQGLGEGLAARPAHGPGYRSRVGVRRKCRHDLDHRLLALAAHHQVEGPTEALGLARRQRAARHQELAAVAQALGEPERLASQRGHGVDAHHGRARRPGRGEGPIAVEEGAVEKLDRVTGPSQGGGHISRPERRKPKARPVAPATEIRVDEQDPRHGAAAVVGRALAGAGSPSASLSIRSS